MPPPLIDGALSDAFVWRLSAAYIGRNSKTERPMKTKIGTEVAHVTRDSDTTFKVKGQGHQTALLSAALTRKVAVAVSVGTYWPWETAATLPSARPREALRRPRRRGAGHTVATARLQLVGDGIPVSLVSHLSSRHAVRLLPERASVSDK